jgi:pimeloyl-ACP methyl ester carboxylesterase
MQSDTSAFGDGLAARDRPGELDSVLWIHGYTLNAAAWMPLWAHLPGWHHIGIDLPSHGRSRPIRDGESLRSLARTLGELALVRGVKHIAALSFGTLVATQIAIEFPNVFATVTLGAPALAGGPQDPEVEQLYRELFEMVEARATAADVQRRWMQSPPPLFYGADGIPWLWEHLCAIIGAHQWSELTGNLMFQLINTRQSERELKRVGAAFLVLVGDKDMPAFRRCGELICRSVPHSQRIYLTDVGHLCMLQDPAAVAPIIDQHLRTHSSSRVRPGN